MLNPISCYNELMRPTVCVYVCMDGCCLTTHVCVCVCMYVCIYIYIYIYRERERDVIPKQ